MSIKEISDIHKRTYNAIKSRVDKVEHLRSNEGSTRNRGSDSIRFGIIRIILICFGKSKNKEDDQESLIHDAI